MKINSVHAHLCDLAVGACNGVCLDNDQLLVGETKLVDQLVVVRRVQLQVT